MLRYFMYNYKSSPFLCVFGDDHVIRYMGAYVVSGGAGVIYSWRGASLGSFYEIYFTKHGVGFMILNLDAFKFSRVFGKEVLFNVNIYLYYFLFYLN